MSASRHRAGAGVLAQVPDAALRGVAERGPGATTIGAIAAEPDAPVGSVHHRFRSRDLPLARLWMRTVRRAQEGFAAAAAGGGSAR